MFYRTLLVHVDESRHLEKRVEVAAKLAVRENAHLIGVAATGSSHLLQHTAAASHDSGDSAANSDAVMGALRRSAEAALKKFETLARAIGATSCEQRLIDDDAAVAVSRQSLYADLIVLGQSDAADLSVAGTVDFPEYVVLNSECPVLIVPRAAGGDVTRYERALVAWNGSGAASRAVRDAMPFLEQATRVQIAVIDTSAASDRQGSESAGELTVFLARHGIHAEVVRRTEDDAGHEILSLAAELGADLLVMGCVAHPHTRSMKLGGATRVVLECATIPVLMSH